MGGGVVMTGGGWALGGGGGVFTYLPSLNFKTCCFSYWGGSHVAVYILLLYFALFSVTIAVLSHLHVICHHFICPMSLFQGHTSVVVWQSDSFLFTIWCFVVFPECANYWRQELVLMPVMVPQVITKLFTGLLVMEMLTLSNFSVVGLYFISFRMSSFLV